MPAQMLQVEMFEDRDRESAPVWWFFSLPTICERLKKSAILFPLSPSSSGQGRHPFKVDIAGSNPAGGTISIKKPVTLAVAGFLLPKCRDSNPEGIKSHCHPKACGQKMANMSTVTILVTAISCHQKAI